MNYDPFAMKTAVSFFFSNFVATIKTPILEDIVVQRSWAQGQIGSATGFGDSHVATKPPPPTLPNSNMCPYPINS
jgi:hypothetical protein